MNVPRKSWLRILSWLLLFLLLLLALFSRRGPPEGLWLDAPGWSRARLVGNTQLNQAVPIALDEAGQVFLFLIRADGERRYPQVVALNRRMHVVWERTFEAVLAEPAEPQVLRAGQELHLFWLSGQGLYAARLDTSGSVRAQPTLVSGRTAVDSYAAALDDSGLVTVWYAGPRREPGVYALPLGDLGGKATLVDRLGMQPLLRYDGRGTLHAIWVTRPPDGPGDRRIYYATYPEGIFSPERQILLVEPDIRVRSTWQGPRFGLDRGHGYVFWTEVTHSAQGSDLKTQFVYFPLDGPASVAAPASVVVPGGAELMYEAFPVGSLKAGSRVSLSRHPGTVSPSGIAVNPAIERELVLASRAQVRHRQGGPVGQINTLFFQDGIPTTYQLLSFTPGGSFAPDVVSDEAGQLYITWLERAEGPGFAVYFASTAPHIREALGSVTWSDVGRMGAATVFGLVTGALLAPFALAVWLLVPSLMLALTWALRRGGESLSNLGARISLAAAFVAYWAVKLIAFPDARTYVPFSTWIPIIPSWLEGLLRLGVPLAIAGLALGAAWRFAVRSRTKSATLCLAVYAAVDTVLTTAVYGALLYDALGLST